MTGINYYIFISALVFGLGLYTLLTAKDAIRVLIAFVMLFMFVKFSRRHNSVC